MVFNETPIEGALLVVPERFEDERGFFARTFCARELSERGLDPTVVQSSLSYNRRSGTLRGMHFQIAPHEENKIVSCQQGSVYDVIIDLRPTSRTYRRWFATNLTATGLEMLFIPKGCAHGFMTLSDDVIVRYDISEYHHPESARGVRYDDPAFGVSWPMVPVTINARDRGYTPYSPFLPR
jgi:dTDP-4-dehydrorhamnose 3,5-epimerase